MTWWCYTMFSGWWAPPTTSIVYGGSAGCSPKCGWYEIPPVCNCMKMMCEICVPEEPE